MSLQAEIDTKRKEIQTDGYPMSIGEIIRLYEDGELDIHPEFQRFFRWSQIQKCKLIESILLGIPIPSIFVSQRSDGVWDVVDGLQRLSTILEFVGVLKDEEGKIIEASRLLGTPYLPALDEKAWEDSRPANSFTQAQRIAFKREKLDIKIIKKESDKSAKFELFQRLNTLGSSLSPQEVRNCLLIMVNRDFFNWLSELASNKHFATCISLSDKQVDQRYDMELVLRFLLFKNSNTDALTGMNDVHEFLTDRMRTAAESASFKFAKEKRVFEQTFELLDGLLGDDCFRRFDATKDRFMGGFSVAAFETISVGIGCNIGTLTNSGKPTPQKSRALIKKVESLWSNPKFKQYSGAGVRGTRRVPELVPLGKKTFS